MIGDTRGIDLTDLILGCDCGRGREVLLTLEGLSDWWLPASEASVGSAMRRQFRFACRAVTGKLLLSTMRDPHVQMLRYSSSHRDDTSFVDPPPVHAAMDAFEAVLKDGRLTITMLEHFPTVEGARAVVERFLRAWELQDELKGAKTGIRFVYEDAKVIDRSPRPPDVRKVIELEAGVYSVSGASATLYVESREYPPPPVKFAVTPDVETLWHRYSGFRKAREPLPAMAYFCLTILERSGGGCRKAAAMYSIDEGVLKTLGKLSSTRGDVSQARKAKGVGAPLSDRERAWLDAAVRLLITRMAEVAGGESVPQVTMNHLPQL